MAVEVANPREMVFVSRFAITTSTGVFQMWQQDKLLWSREESLANIQATAFVDLPQYLNADAARIGGTSRAFRHAWGLRVGQHVVERYLSISTDLSLASESA